MLTAQELKQALLIRQPFSLLDFIVEYLADDKNFPSAYDEYVANILVPSLQTQKDDLVNQADSIQSKIDMLNVNAISIPVSKVALN